MAVTLRIVGTLVTVLGLLSAGLLVKQFPRAEEMAMGAVILTLYHLFFAVLCFGVAKVLDRIPERS
jgi:hypothetical protein